MRYTLAILLLVATVGCSNPKNTKIPQDLSKIESIKPSIEKLTPEERELFGSYMMMRMMGTVGENKGIPEGMTIGKAIEEQRAFTKDMKPVQIADRLKKKKESPTK
ncbi:MAG: hypothetical protein HGB30_13090 [Holophagaceae bacterium]|nr:hypothetical protein [Holophagaceae bacterium]